jgi:hypothetical protein
MFRRLAVFALGQIGPEAPAAVPALIEALAEDDLRSQALIRVALLKIGAGAIPALLEALADEDPRLRRQAALVLARSPYRHVAATALLSCMRDTDSGVRTAATAALAACTHAP